MRGTAATIIHAGPASRPLSARGLPRLLVPVETRQPRGSSVVGYQSDLDTAILRRFRVFPGRIENGLVRDYPR